MTSPADRLAPAAAIVQIVESTPRAPRTLDVRGR